MDEYNTEPEEVAPDPILREHNNRRVPNEEQLNSKLHDFRQPCNDSQLVMRDRLQASG